MNGLNDLSDPELRAIAELLYRKALREIEAGNADQETIRACNELRKQLEENK